MASNSETLHIHPESELGLRIRAAADSGEVIIVDIDDETYPCRRAFPSQTNP